MAIAWNGVNHFAISVPDMEASVAWYERVFGFKVFDRSEIPGAGIRVSHMVSRGLVLEIFQAPNAAPLPEDRTVPNRDLMTHGNKHISFGVPDGPAAKAELEALGVEIVMVAEVDNTYGLFIRDNSGNLIEIFEEAGLWWEKVCKMRESFFKTEEV